MNPARVALVGIRSVDEGERAHLRKAGVHVYTMSDIDRGGILKVMKKAIMATVITDIGAMQREADGLRRAGKRIAVVPTMGALHEGHLALVRAGSARADIVVTTVFVNPSQFGSGEDFAKYPGDLPTDVRLASGAGSDYVFSPDAASMYPPGYATFVNVERLTEVLEGKIRPGHFRGVATIVVRLMNIVKPHVAVFGQKDAQQVVVVRRLLRDLNLDIDLVVVPTVREADGLALSSRNVYLTAGERARAPVLHDALRHAERSVRAGVRSCARIVEEIEGTIRSVPGPIIEYVSIADSETLEERSECRPGQAMLISLAVRFGTTRLIDNIIVTPE